MTFKSPFPPLPPVTAPSSGAVDHGVPVGNPAGLSTLEYCRSLPKRRYGYAAKGLLLWFPATRMVMVPYSLNRTGSWTCVVVVADPAGVYQPGGYSLSVCDEEIETAIEVSPEQLAAAVVGSGGQLAVAELASSI